MLYFVILVYHTTVILALRLFGPHQLVVMPVMFLAEISVLFRTMLTFPDTQDFITEEYQKSVKEVLDNALQGRETANFEFPLYTKDQRRVEVLLNATTRRDVSGNVVGVLGVGQDITERKQVEVEKTRVAQELQTFIDTANAPIFGIDANGLVNEWNNKSAAITGFSREEVLGRNLVQDFITKEYQVSVKEVLDNALQGRETANFEFPLYTKDQRRVDVLLNATTRRDVSGYVVGVLGVGQDITERKQVEMEKTRVAKELQTFIDTANAPIFGIDANGLVNEWNNKSAAITGFSRKEVLGKNLVQVVPMLLVVFVSNLPTRNCYAFTTPSVLRYLSLFSFTGFYNSRVSGQRERGSG